MGQTETVLAAVDAPVVVLDGERRVVWSNRAFAEIVNARPGAVPEDLFCGARGGVIAEAPGLGGLVELVDAALRGEAVEAGAGDGVSLNDGVGRVDWRARAGRGGARVYCVGSPVPSASALFEQCPLPLALHDLEGTPLAANRRSREAGGPDGGSEPVVRATVQGDDGTELAVLDVGGVAEDRTSGTGRGGAPAVERERLLEAILRASPDIISLLDGEGRVRQVSQASATLLGHELSDTEEEDLLATAHPDDLAEASAQFAALLDGSVPTVSVRYRVRHAQGHWVTVDSRARAIAGEDALVTGAVVVTRDVTATLEQQLRLQEAVDAARQASAAKSEFLSRMSHELRTPLNSILGFAQLLQLDALGDSQSEGVDHVLRAGRNLLELIDEVLDIARIETGYFELDTAEVDVEELLAEACSGVGHLADAGGVRVSVDVRGPAAVRADRSRLLTVLRHVLANAVQYNRPGGTVQVMCQLARPRWARVSVSDTGRGIRPEDLGRVFEPFERLEAELGGVEGTGVGLALSKHLIEHMGGRIGVESVPHVGSTFWLELPSVS